MSRHPVHGTVCEQLTVAHVRLDMAVTGLLLGDGSDLIVVRNGEGLVLRGLSRQALEGLARELSRLAKRMGDENRESSALRGLACAGSA